MKKKIRIILQICPVLLLGIFVWLGPTTKGEKTQYQKKYEKIESSKKGENLELVKEVAQEANTKYKDGVFQGSAKGYSGTVTVEVEIKNSKITSIKVLRNSDTPSFFGQAKSKVIDAIISAQNTKVDVVTGATYSSKGIINAVRNALIKAAVDPNSVEAAENNSNENKKESANNKETVLGQKNATASVEIPKDYVGKFPYEDGEYIGKAKGFGGNITVAVVIKQEAIEKIRIIQNEADNEPYFGKAKTVLNSILSSQNVEVDVVSGATYSSKGIINAVKNALKTATIKKKNNANQTVQQAPIEQQLVPKYKDGVYEAIVACDPGNSRHFKKYDLHVKVEIKDGKITDISEIYGTGRDYIAANLKFINKAAYGADGQKGITDQISEIDTLDKVNRENIDKVSRATFSSNSIIEAIEKCLEQAKES